MKNTYIVTLPHTSGSDFYNEVAGLSSDPKDIPVFKGYTNTPDLNDPLYSKFSINVTEEDLNFLKLKYNFNSVRQTPV